MLTQRDKNILPGGRDHETAMRLLNEPGAVLQWLRPDGNARWYDFEEADLVEPFADDLEWRIKPKTLRYRLCKCSDFVQATRIGVAHNEQEAVVLERSHNFVEWIGDWQEVEV